MSQQTDWVAVYVEMRKGLTAKRGSVGKSKGGNALPLMTVPDALLMAGTWIIILEGALRADGATIEPTREQWQPSLHEYILAPPSPGDAWVKQRRIKDPFTGIAGWEPADIVCEARVRPPDAGWFKGEMFDKRLKVYQELVRGLQKMALWPQDLPRAGIYLSKEVTERLWDGGYQVMINLGSLGATNIPTAEFREAFIQGAKEGVADVKVAVDKVAAAGGAVLGDVAESVGRAAGNAVGGLFSGTGLIGIVVLGAALSYKLGWF